MKMSSVQETMQLIKELVSIPSPTGNTYQIIEHIHQLLQEQGVETRLNRKGGLIATIPGRDESKHRMLTAHVDTLGAMVKEIKPDGRLKIDLIGGFRYNSIEGEYCRIETSSGKIYTKHVLKVHQYNVSCASAVSQKAALEAVTNGVDDALIMREQYKKRLDYVYDRLISMGLPVIKPSGAFYIFPSIESFGMSSFDFCMELLESTRLAVVPGSAFSPLGEGYVRLSYAYSLETLKEGLDRLEQFVLEKRSIHSLD